MSFRCLTAACVQPITRAVRAALDARRRRRFRRSLAEAAANARAAADPESPIVPAPLQRGLTPSQRAWQVTPANIELFRRLPAPLQQAVMAEPASLRRHGSFAARLRAAQGDRDLQALAWQQLLTEHEGVPTLTVPAHQLPLACGAAAVGTLHAAGARGLRVHRWTAPLMSIAQTQTEGLHDLCAGLVYMPWLQVLDLTSAYLRKAEHAAALFAALPQLRRLRHLALGHLPRMRRRNRAFQVTTLTALESLSLRADSELLYQTGERTWRAAPTLEAFLRNAQQLTRLHLADMPQSRDVAACLAAIAQHAQLRELHLQALDISSTVAVAQCLAAVQANARLERLALSFCWLGHNGLDVLTLQLRGRTALTALDLSGCNSLFEQSWFKRFAALPALHSLNLSGNRFRGDKRVSMLAPFARLTALTSLQLPALRGGNLNGPPSTGQLAPIAMLPQLQCLTLLWNHFPAHVQPLLPTLAQLTRLALSLVSFTGEEAERRNVEALAAALLSATALKDFSLQLLDLHVPTATAVIAALPPAQLTALDLSCVSMHFAVAAADADARAADLQEALQALRAQLAAMQALRVLALNVPPPNPHELHVLLTIDGRADLLTSSSLVRVVAAACTELPNLEALLLAPGEVPLQDFVSLTEVLAQCATLATITLWCSVLVTEPRSDEVPLNAAARDVLGDDVDKFDIALGHVAADDPYSWRHVGQLFCYAGSCLARAPALRTLRLPGLLPHNSVVGGGFAAVSLMRGLHVSRTLRHLTLFEPELLLDDITLARLVYLGVPAQLPRNELEHFRLCSSVMMDEHRKLFSRTAYQLHASDFAPLPESPRRSGFFVLDPYGAMW